MLGLHRISAYFWLRDKKSSSARAVHCWFSLPHPCCIKVTKLSLGSIVCNIFPFCGASVVQVCCKTWCQVVVKQKLLPSHFIFCCIKGWANHPTRDVSAGWSHSLQFRCSPFLRCFLLLFPGDISRLSYCVWCSSLVFSHLHPVVV